MQVTMKDRVAVITGGSKGIGHGGGTAVRRLRRQGRDPRARRGRPEGGAGAARQGQHRRFATMSATSRRLPISPSAHEKIVADLGPVDILVNNAGTGTDDGVREHLGRGLAGRPRPQTVCRDPLLQAGLAGHEGAQMGPHHQRAQHLRQGAGSVLGANLGIAGGRHGADQGDGERRRRAQHPGQCHAGRPDHERSMGEAARRTGAGHGLRGVCEKPRQGHAAGAHRHGGGIRQPGLLPRLRSGIVHHRHRHQCRRRPFCRWCSSAHRGFILRDAGAACSAAPHEAGPERARHGPGAAEHRSRAMRRIRDTRPSSNAAQQTKRPPSPGPFRFLKPPWRPLLRPRPWRP